MDLSSAEVTSMLPVKDMERARRFYEQGLGLTPVGLQADGKFTCRFGGTTPALFPNPKGTEAEHTVARFEFERIEPAVAALKARGVRFADHDLPGPKTVEHVCVLGSEKATWFEGTEPNILCLHEDVG